MQSPLARYQHFIEARIRDARHEFNVPDDKIFFHSILGQTQEVYVRLWKALGPQLLDHHAMLKYIRMTARSVVIDDVRGVVDVVSIEDDLAQTKYRRYPTSNRSLALLSEFAKTLTDREWTLFGLARCGVQIHARDAQWIVDALIGDMSIDARKKAMSRLNEKLTDWVTRHRRDADHMDEPDEPTFSAITEQFNQALQSEGCRCASPDESAPCNPERNCLTIVRDVAINQARIAAINHDFPSFSEAIEIASASLEQLLERAAL